MDHFFIALRKRLSLLAALSLLSLGAGCKIGDYDFNGKTMLKTFLESDNREPRTHQEMHEDHNNSEWLRHYYDPSYNPKYQGFLGEATDSPPGISPLLRD